MKPYISLSLLLITAFFSSSPLWAQNSLPQTQEQFKITHSQNKFDSSIHYQTRQKPKFVWGADAGGAVDMSSNDMSSMDFSIYGGMRYGWFDLIGLGFEADVMISNSSRSFPVFAVARTSFSSFPKLVFLELRGGPSINYLSDDIHQTGFFGFAGIGFNLARSPKFTSYFLLGYQIVTIKSMPEHEIPSTAYQYAALRLGITF